MLLEETRNHGLSLLASLRDRQKFACRDQHTDFWEISHNHSLLVASFTHSNHCVSSLCSCTFILLHSSATCRLVGFQKAFFACFPFNRQNLLLLQTEKAQSFFQDFHWKAKNHSKELPVWEREILVLLMLLHNALACYNCNACGASEKKQCF